MHIYLCNNLMTIVVEQHNKNKLKPGEDECNREYPSKLLTSPMG